MNRFYLKNFRNVVSRRVMRVKRRIPGNQRFGTWVLDLSDRWNWARCRLRYGDLLPTFAIVGAQKAGTTSLHHYLNQHPEIFMGSFKETNFFLTDSDEKGPYYELEPFTQGRSNHQKRGGLSDSQILRRKFRGYRGQRVIGDASPYYTCAPFTAMETPERMHRLRPQMQIVYSLRNPLSRIISNYEHEARIHDRIGKPFADDFNTRFPTRQHYLETSLYFKQIKRYLEFFPIAQIHVLLFEDLIARPDSTLANLVRFLNVDENFCFDFSIVHNQGNKNRSSDEEVFSRANFSRIIEPIKRDVAALENLLGRSLAMWDLSEKRWCNPQL